MAEFEKHILILCLCVFTILVVVMTLLIAIIYKQSVRLATLGEFDPKIKKEYEKNMNHPTKYKVLNVVDIILQVILMLLICGVLGFTIYSTVSQNNVVGDVPLLKTVNTDSMSEKNKANKYLYDEKLNNQIKTSDLIVLHRLPDSNDIQLYDIVLYESEIDHMLVLHRIVKIYEIGEIGNDERLFVFQGDAIPSNDANYVSYSQMKGIYKNEKAKHVGSFIRFLHSPAGYVCIILAFITVIAMIVFEYKFKKIRDDRLKEMGLVVQKGNQK